MAESDPAFKNAVESAFRSLHAELGRARELLDRQAGDLAELRAGIDLLVQVLVARGDLGTGHERLLRKVSVRARSPDRKVVHLGVLQDKYAVAVPDIDCAKLAPLCQVRCCSFRVNLTTQDIEGGKVKWEIDQPYLLRHDADGYCAHLDRAIGGCTIYEERPGICRSYDCRADQRVWLDFEKRIPAPMPIEVIPRSP